MWSRRDWGRWCASAVLTSGLPVARAQSRSAVRRSSLGTVVVAVDHKASFGYLPLTIAEQLGYFAMGGLDLQVREISEPGQALHAVVAGTAQLVSGAYSDIIKSQVEGHLMKSIVLQGRTPQIVLGVSLRTMQHYRELRDLRGRRVAVTSLGSTSHRFARLLLSKAGIGHQEVSYQVLADPSAAVAAFRTGRVDAVCFDDPLITQLEQGGELRVVADTRSVRGNAEVFGGPMPEGCLGASGEFVAQNPKKCQAIADGIVLALKWLQTAGPSDLIKTVPEHYFNGDRALYLTAFTRARESWAPDGLMPLTGPKNTLNMLATFEGDQQWRRVNLASTFTNEFVSNAKQRFRL